MRNPSGPIFPTPLPRNGCNLWNMIPILKIVHLIFWINKSKMACRCPVKPFAGIQLQQEIESVTFQINPEVPHTAREMTINQSLLTQKQKLKMCVHRIWPAPTNWGHQFADKQKSVILIGSQNELDEALFEGKLITSSLSISIVQTSPRFLSF